MPRRIPKITPLLIQFTAFGPGVITLIDQKLANINQAERVINTPVGR
jgi:hypothetical protein